MSCRVAKLSWLLSAKSVRSLRRLFMMHEKNLQVCSQ